MNSQAIRQAAILVAALDMDAADALLDQMPEDFATAVRQCVMELDEIDTEEEQDVIGKFLGRDVEESVELKSGSSQEVVQSPIVSLEDYLTECSTSSVKKEAFAVGNDVSLTTEQTSQTHQPLGFLNEADHEQIFRALSSEHSQVTALVFSHLPAQQAAAVMARMPAEDQVTIARRMAELGEVDAETLCEIAAALKLRLEPLPTQGASTGLKAIQSIVTTDRLESQEILRNLQQGDARLARQLSAAESAPRVSDRFAPANMTTNDDGGTVDAPQMHCEFEDLQQLSDDDLGKILQRAEGRVVLLALAGASENLITKVYRQLPRADSQALKRQIEQQGTIRLRDVEEAQRRICQIAIQLASADTVALPKARRFVTAA